MPRRPSISASAVALFALMTMTGSATGQLVEVEPANELHTAPWFADLRGLSDPSPNRNGAGGGFIATAKANASGDGYETVRYSYSCGNVTTTESPTPDPSTGLVTGLIDCASDTVYDPVTLLIHNVKDGGWYWVFRPIGTGTDLDVAVAAAPLIRTDVLAGAPVQLPTDPGHPSFSVDEYGLAVDADGRGSGGATVIADDGNRVFDIFPHSKAVSPPAGCHGLHEGGSTSRNAGCVVGESDDWTIAVSDSQGAALGGAVVRPASGGDAVALTVDLGLTTGHLVQDCADMVEAALSGGLSGTTSIDTPGNVALQATSVAPTGCPGAADLGFAWTVNVDADDTRCASANVPDRNTAQTVRVTVTQPTTGTEIAPGLPAAGLWAEFQVTCPAAASSNLVPENPFEPGRRP